MIEICICLALSIYGFTIGAQYPSIFQVINIFASTVFITRYFQINTPSHIDIGGMLSIIWINIIIGQRIRRLIK